MRFSSHVKISSYRTRCAGQLSRRSAILPVVMGLTSTHHREYENLSKLSRANIGSHYRSDPVRVQSTKLFGRFSYRNLNIYLMLTSIYCPIPYHHISTDDRSCKHWRLPERNGKCGRNPGSKNCIYSQLCALITATFSKRRKIGSL